MALFALLGGGSASAFFALAAALFAPLETTCAQVASFAPVPVTPSPDVLESAGGGGFALAAGGGALGALSPFLGAVLAAFFAGVASARPFRGFVAGAVIGATPISRRRRGRTP